MGAVADVSGITVVSFQLSVVRRLPLIAAGAYPSGCGERNLRNAEFRPDFGLRFGLGLVDYAGAISGLPVIRPELDYLLVK